jgi:hypothetical protein
MGADFPLLSNEILLPNLVFFRSLLEFEAEIPTRGDANIEASHSSLLP